MRRLFFDPPREVVASFCLGGCLERGDVYALGVHQREGVSRQATLARGVHPLQHEKHAPRSAAAALGEQPLLQVRELAAHRGQGSLAVLLPTLEQRRGPGVVRRQLHGSTVNGQRLDGRFAHAGQYARATAHSSSTWSMTQNSLPSGSRSTTKSASSGYGQLSTRVAPSSTSRRTCRSWSLVYRSRCKRTGSTGGASARCSDTGSRCRSGCSSIMKSGSQSDSRGRYPRAAVQNSTARRMSCTLTTTVATCRSPTGSSSMAPIVGSPD